MVVLRLQCRDGRGTDGARQQRNQGEFPMRGKNPKEGAEVHPLASLSHATRGASALFTAHRPRKA